MLKIPLKYLSLSMAVLVLLVTFCFIPSTFAIPNNILIYIQDDVYEDYLHFIDGKDALDITDFSGKKIRRDIVDMIIVQQALKLGGFHSNFSYAPGKVNFRNTKMLQSGRLLISFDSYWLQDAEVLTDDIYISSAVIRRGEYIAGLYTSPQNIRALNVKGLSDLTQFTAVSTPKWITDWQTLQGLPLKELVREDSWLSMARMVNIQWVDFLLMPFNSTPDQSFTLEKIKLIPVKNIAVVLKDSRHFVISKVHPNGSEAILAINKGLKKLRKKGTITKAYQQAGFFIDKLNIKILNK